MNDLLILILLIVLLVNPIGSQNIDWQHVYGGPEIDWVYDIKETSDSGFILSGLSAGQGGDVSSSNGSMDAWIVKLNESGEIEWENCFGGTSLDRSHAIIETVDQEFIFVGKKGVSDVWVVKLNSNGEILWESSLGGSDFDVPTDIVLTPSGDFYVVGTTNSLDFDDIILHGSYDYLVLKYNQDGEVIWKKNFGGTMEDRGISVQSTVDGGLVVAGYSNSVDNDISENKGKFDYWITKLSENGNLEWERNYGGSESEFARSIFETADLGFIIAGESSSNDGDISSIENHGEKDAWIIKLTQEGNVEWERSYGGSENDFASSIKQTQDGGYVFVGSTESIDGDLSPTDKLDLNIWFMKLNGIGEIQDNFVFGGTDLDRGVDVVQIDNDEYVLLGTAKSSDGDLNINNGDDDFWIMKLSQISVSNSEIQKPNNSFKVFPNPSSGDITCSLEEITTPTTITISGITGNLVLSRSIKEKETIIEGLGRGIYVVTISSDTFISTQKVIVN